jgi:hypothetical protein
MPQLIANIGGVVSMEATVNNQPDAFAQDKINRMIGMSQFGHLVRMHGGTAVGDLCHRRIAFDKFIVGK